MKKNVLLLAMGLAAASTVSAGEVGRWYQFLQPAAGSQSAKGAAQPRQR
jgi:hypothetical protein